jgi:hypothetical protein
MLFLGSPRISDVSVAPAQQGTAPTRVGFTRWLQFGMGVASALLLVELGLHPLTTALNNVWLPIGVDKLDGSTREVRRFTEAFAASHFSLSRARLTGNPPIPGASTGVILGDSHVEAVEVSDGQTMGALLERSLRLSGRMVNVRQYGWFGEDVPKYVQVGPEVMEVWDPAWVVVVITASDLGPSLMYGRVHLVQDPDGRWGAAASPAGAPPGRARQLGEKALSKSVLLYHLAKRAQTVGVPLLRVKHGRAIKASLRPGRLPLSQRALIGLTALRDTYGDRLRILFAADVGVDGLSPKSPAEEAVFSACASLGLQCADTRDRMIQDRQDSVRLSRGFLNSAPGVGHLNEVGHALAAGTILRDLVAP